MTKHNILQKDYTLHQTYNQLKLPFNIDVIIPEKYFCLEKSSHKNLEKLLDKMAAFVEECETLYGFRIVYKNRVKMKHVKKLRKNFMPSKNLRDLFLYMVRENAKVRSKEVLKRWKNIWIN